MGEAETSPAPAPAPPSSDDPHQWHQVFTALVEMVRSQQLQIDSLAGDRKFLQEYIHLHHSNAASRADLLKSHISQTKEEAEMVRRVHAAKLDLTVTVKEREARLYKKKLELAESDLEDFRICVEALGAEIVLLKEQLKCREGDKGDTVIGDSEIVKDLKANEQNVLALEKEIKKLKHDHKKVISKKDADISALVAEKDFVWNQFKRVDDEYADLLKTKQTEAESTTETIQMLHRSLEVLQSSANEKDETIAKLASERDSLESDVRTLTYEAEQMRGKIEKLQLDAEELGLLTTEKDGVIARLRSELEKIEMSSSRRITGKSRLSKDSNSQCRSRDGSATLGEGYKRKGSRKASLQNVEGPSSQNRRIVNESSSGPQTVGAATGTGRANLKSKNVSATPGESYTRKRSRKVSLQIVDDHSSQKHKLVHGSSSGPQTAGTVTGLRRCQTALQVESCSTPLETPRLFSSKLKVPKLKNLPP